MSFLLNVKLNILFKILTQIRMTFITLKSFVIVTLKHRMEDKKNLALVRGLAFYESGLIRE